MGNMGKMKGSFQQSSKRAKPSTGCQQKVLVVMICGSTSKKRDKKGRKEEITK
jgi:hypothetical protein